MPLHKIRLAQLPLIHQGKVRDIFAVSDDHMLIVTTDRLSAFDVILPDPIPDKGRILTSVSNFWFKKLESVTKNHLVDYPLSSLPVTSEELEQLQGRSIVVKRLKPLPVEAIVRGYIIGSGWKDYQATGQLCGLQLPKGLKQAERLPSVIFTPSTKAEVGGHDVNIDFAHMVNVIGEDLAEQVRATSLALYSRAAEYALERGIIIADTKFEFGLDESDQLVLMDEILTPDSSRFWPVDGYKEGTSPASFDKQFVRDYLETLDWDKAPPGPHLPEEIIQQTVDKYKEVSRRLLT